MGPPILSGHQVWWINQFFYAFQKARKFGATLQNDICSFVYQMYLLTKCICFKGQVPNRKWSVPEPHHRTWDMLLLLNFTGQASIIGKRQTYIFVICIYPSVFLWVKITSSNSYIFPPHLVTNQPIKCSEQESSLLFKLVYLLLPLNWQFDDKYYKDFGETSKAFRSHMLSIPQQLQKSASLIWHLHLCFFLRFIKAE